jgi:hypothetical protein
MCAGSEEQLLRLTPGVWTEGLLSELFGLFGRTGVCGVVEEAAGREALGVVG